ncbi:MAG TPA: YopX family protein [Flexilinea sp.]|nr:YopX family protein [Flexilinea sp.]
MKDIIEFRGKSEDSGKWIFGDLMVHQPFLEENFYIKSNKKGPITWEKIKPITIGQYTGFSIRGQKIYHGDIIKIREENESGIDHIIYCVVVWVKEWGMFATLLTDEYSKYLESGVDELDDLLIWTYTLEDTDSIKHFICGNIFDHKELLNK